jgi:hypothetical protein
MSSSEPAETSVRVVKQMLLSLAWSSELEKRPFCSTTFAAQTGRLRIRVFRHTEETTNKTEPLYRIPQKRIAFAGRSLTFSESDNAYYAIDGLLLTP